MALHSQQNTLKNGGSEMILSFWGSAYFQGRAVSFREV